MDTMISTVEIDGRTLTVRTHESAAGLTEFYGWLSDELGLEDEAIDELLATVDSRDDSRYTHVDVDLTM